MTDQEMIQHHSSLISEADYAEAEITNQQTDLEDFEERARIAKEEIEFQEEELHDINNEITEVELEWEGSHRCLCGLWKTESSCSHEGVK